MTETITEKTFDLQKQLLSVTDYNEYEFTKSPLIWTGEIRQIIQMWNAYLSKLVCAILAMKVASPTTWAILPRASPAAQRRMGLGLSIAPITRASADLRTSSGPRVLLFSAKPFSRAERTHYLSLSILTE